VVVTGLAVVVRASGINADPLRFNEAFSWRLSRLPVAELVRRTAADFHPPLDYLILKAWTGLVGDSVVALRAPSLAFSSLGVLFVYLSGLELLKLDDGRGRAAGAPSATWAAATAAALAALNAQQVAMGQSARMYALGIALAGGSLWALLRAINGRGRAAWSAFAVASTLSLYTHNYAIFTVAAHFAVGGLLIATRARGTDDRAATLRDLGRLALAGVVVAVAYAPWMAVLSGQARDVAAGHWIDWPDDRDLLAELGVWSVGAGNLGRVELAVVGAILALLLAVAVVRSGRAGAAAIALAAAPWIGCLAAGPIVGRPLYQARYLTFAQLPFFLAIGLGVASLPGRFARFAVAAALIATAALGEWDRPWGPSPGMPAIGAAVADLSGSIRSTDLVVVRSPAELDLVRYYLRQVGIANPVASAVSLRGRGLGRVSYGAAIGPGDSLSDHELARPSGRRVWLVTSDPTSASSLIGGFEPTRTSTYAGPDGSKLFVRLFERPSTAGPLPSRRPP